MGNKSSRGIQVKSNTATPQHCNNAVLQYRNTAKSQYCNTATLQYRNTAIPQHCNTATPQHCNTATLQHCNTAISQLRLCYSTAVLRSTAALRSRFGYCTQYCSIAQYRNTTLKVSSYSISIYELTFRVVLRYCAVLQHSDLDLVTVPSTAVLRNTATQP